MKKYISVNMVSQALILLSAIVEHKCFSLNELAQIKMPYGVNCDSALSFAQQCQWVSASNDTLSITQSGDSILSQFDGLFIAKRLWRDILMTYISSCHPVWARRIPFGRKEAFLFMNAEEQECFYEADLIESFDKDVIEWWDTIAQQERKTADESKNEIGRHGELLTIEYEKQRTNCQPEWRSIESNVAGYDVLSQQSNSDSSPILIEVKTSSLPIRDASFEVTKNEWNTAIKPNNYQRYYFYLWCIHDTSNCELAVIPAREIKAHIPENSGVGTWETTRVPFSAFTEYFVETE